MSALAFNPIPSPKLLNTAAPDNTRADTGAADSGNPFAALLSGVLQGTAALPAPPAPEASNPGLASVTAASGAGPPGTVLPELPGSLTTGVGPAPGAATGPLPGNPLPATGNNLPLPLSSLPLDSPAGAPAPDAPTAGVSLADLAAMRPLEPVTPGPGAALPGSIADAGTGQQSAAAAVPFFGRFATRGAPAPALQLTGGASTPATDLSPVDTGDGSDPLADIPVPDTTNLRLTVADLLRTIATPTVGAQLAAFATTSDKATTPTGTTVGSGMAAGTMTDITGNGLAGSLGSVSLPALQPLGNAGSFANGLADRLLTLGGPGNHSARLQLHPEHLGALDVEIHLDDGTAQVWFGTSTPQARAAIEASLPKLHELFAEQGIQLTRTQVDSGSGQQSGYGTGQNGDAYRRAPESPAGYRDVDWRQSIRAATAPVGLPVGAGRPSSRLVDVWA